MRERIGMRSGLAAASALALLLCGPAGAEPASKPSATNAAAAAAAAAHAAKTAPKPTAPQPAQSETAATQPPAPAVPATDEAPAEPDATADAPPAAEPAAASTGAPAPKPATPPTAAKAPVPDEKTKAPEKPKLVAAKTLFGAAKNPAPLAARAIGTYARGCLSGAKPLAVDGPAWQAMRLSRNRTWGHPDLIALLERFAGEVKEDGWPGLLVGDISQPRGGPMLTGHASHQLGLDADIWFTPMPDHRMSRKERETLSATSMLSGDSLSVDPKVWSDSRVKIIKRVASYPKVERVLVHPAIKKALCQAAGTDRTWLKKVRPYWGHFYHFHVRIGCPAGSATCKAQAPVPGDDGCGKELDDWFQLLTRKPKPKPPSPEPKIVVKPKPKPQITLDDLPAECRDVLAKDSDIKLPPPVLATTITGKKKAAEKAIAPAHKDAASTPKAKSSAKPGAPAAETKAAAAKSTEKTKEQ